MSLVTFHHWTIIFGNCMLLSNLSMWNSQHSNKYWMLAEKQNSVWIYSFQFWASLAFVFGSLLWETSVKLVWVTAQIRDPAALSQADPRQIVHSHTLRQRKSMSPDSTAGSVTQGRLTDRYEPANDNVCVNASARCCTLTFLAIPPSNYICILCFLSVHSLRRASYKG